VVSKRECKPRTERGTQESESRNEMKEAAKAMQAGRERNVSNAEA